jgi:methyl-accepting chemotaxis protein
MKKWLYRIIGLALILGSLFGLLLSASGIFFVWSTKPSVINRVEYELNLLERTLGATDELFQVIDDSLANAEESLLTIESVSLNLATTLNDSIPMMESIADIIGDDLSIVMQDVQASLVSLQTSAKLIDDTLVLISSIPFVGARYTPDVPVYVSIGQVSQSLAPLAETFLEVQADLDATTANVGQIRTEVENLSTQIQSFGDNIDQAQLVMEEYQVIVGEAELEVVEMQEKLNQAINLIAIGITLLMLWLAIAQVALFTQGLEIFNQGHRFFRHPLDI